MKAIITLIAGLLLIGCASKQGANAPADTAYSTDITISDLDTQHDRQKPRTSLEVQVGPERFSFAV
ncbi:MAG: hypothetical protein AAFR29_08200, partial [Pseudomonadota bacterium]